MLDLADPRAAQVAPARHLIERHRLRAAQAETELDHESVSLGQASKRVAEPIHVDVQVLLERELGRLVAHEVSERERTVLTQRFLQRGDWCGRAPQLLHA